jgi:hypothetical protein
MYPKFKKNNRNEATKIAKREKNLQIIRIGLMMEGESKRAMKKNKSRELQ